MQKNWIGKSVGADIKFDIVNDEKVKIKDKKITVYTTRPDTIYGASFLALAPDHKLSKVLSQTNNDIKKFIEEWEKTFSNEEAIDKGPKEGVFTDLFVIQPYYKKRSYHLYS